MFTFPNTPEKLTIAEQGIVDYIASHRDEFLCMTISRLSETLNISEATISRFSRHVGFKDFKSLKLYIMENTSRRGPAQKVSNTLRTGSGDFLSYWMEKQRFNIQKTLEMMDQDEFNRAVEAIKAARRVFIYAKNASGAPARLAEFRLSRLGLDTRFLPTGGTELLERLAAVEAGDIVIIFGFSKLSKGASVILEQRAKAGFKVILFTSRTYHDDNADIRLFVYRGEENEFHSMCAPSAVVDAIALALSKSMGDEAMGRLEAIQRLKTEYKDRI